MFVFSDESYPIHSALLRRDVNAVKLLIKARSAPVNATDQVITISELFL